MVQSDICFVAVDSSDMTCVGVSEESAHGVFIYMLHPFFTSAVVDCRGIPSVSADGAGGMLGVPSTVFLWEHAQKQVDALHSQK